MLEPLDPFLNMPDDAEPSNTSNPFLAIVSAMRLRGEDLEILAKELAFALSWILKEEAPNQDFHAEIDRLLFQES